MRNEKYRSKVDAALLDIAVNHNNSLYVELKRRNKKNMDKTAIFYRGNSIKYSEMFAMVEKYVKSFQALGIKAGDEIPVCVNNCPEITYILLAASYIGARVNIFGSEFEKDYITHIIDECNNNVLFISDDMYNELRDSIKESNKTENIIAISLADSLPNGEDYYKDVDNKFLELSNKVGMLKKDDNRIITQNEFLELGKNESLQEPFDTNIEDAFTITYSSGSTNSTRPKGIVHNTKSYITMGRFHDTDLSGAPSMHNLRVLAQIPTFSNTNIMSNITDTLMQGSTICYEPIYNSDFYLYSLIINKVNFVTATRSFNIKMAKQILYDPKFSKVKLPDLFALFSVGEPTVPNEEKLINQALRKASAGRKKLPIPAVLSMAGGDCEHGGIFFTMFKSWQEKRLSNMLRKTQLGMTPHRMADCIVLDENGIECKHGELGRLYAYSPCNMIEYRNEPEKTKQFFNTINGIEYGDCSVLATQDEKGHVNMKGRIEKSIPLYISKACTQIQECFLKDTKNILSCEVVPVLINDDYNFIVHFEVMPDINYDENKEKILDSAMGRFSATLGYGIINSISFIRHKDGFSLTGCGKRSFNKIKELTITDSFKFDMNTKQIVPYVSSENSIQYKKISK